MARHIISLDYQSHNFKPRYRRLLGKSVNRQQPRKEKKERTSDAPATLMTTAISDFYKRRARRLPYDTLLLKTLKIGIICLYG